MSAWLIAFAVAITGYPPPERFPDIITRSVAWFETHCAARHCAGRMITHGNKIIIAADQDILNNTAAQALLVHEIIHILQTNAYGKATSCAERLRREREAIMGQVIYLSRLKPVSRVDVGMVLRGYHCRRSPASQPPRGLADTE